MKSNQPWRSHVRTCLVARLFSNTLSPGKSAALVIAAALLLGFSASAATVVWNWTSGDRNWSTTGNWTGGVPASTNAVIFNNTDAQVDTNTVNTVDVSTNVSSLSYTNFSATTYASFQNTTVASTKTLTITNGLNVGRGSSATGGGNVYTYASITGAGGAVAVSGGNVAIADQGNSGAGSGDQLYAVLDLRGLGVFGYSNAAGTFRVAAGSRRQNGEMYLAGTNSITASAATLGAGGTAGIGSGPGKLHLGQTNNLFANTITVGQRTTSSLIDFQTGLADPVVKICAADGVNGVANWYLGWHSSPTQNGNNSSGTCDFSGGILNASVTNLYVGYMNGSAPTGSRTASGTFIMGTNVNNSLVVQNLFVANLSVGTGGTSSSSTGNFVVGGGTVAATAVTLAAQPGGYVANGTLTLSNGASMNVSGNIASGGGTSTISISSATLTVNGLIGAPTPTANNVGTMSLNAATLGLTLVAPGDYANAAASVGTLNIDGAAGSTLLKINNVGPSPGQYPLIGYTSLFGAAGFSGLSVQAPAGYTATLVNNTANSPYNTIDVVLNASQLTWNGVPNGDWDIGITGNWKSGAKYNQVAGVGPLVLFDDTASGTTNVNLTTTLSPTGITVNNTNLNYTFAGSGKLSGAGGLNKQGLGTLTLVQTGVNDYAGTTGVGAGGKLAVGNGGTAGNVGPGPLAVNGTLEVNRSDNVTLSNSISGIGGLNKPGANTLTLAGAVNLTGSSAISTISGGTLEMIPSATDTLAGDITGNGGLAINGPGTVVLSGSGNSYSSGTLISAGTLQIGDGVNAGSLPGNVTDQGSLVFNGGYYNLANNISGSGSVMSVGSGCSFTLAGNNTYTGPTTIRNGGTLYLGASGGMPSQSVLVLGESSGPSIGSADFTGYNVVMGGLTVGGNQASPNTITLGSGQSLTINGNVNIGNTAGGSAQANLTVNGAGASLTVNTNGGVIQLGRSTAGDNTGPNNVNCNLTGLDTFVASLGATGQIIIGETNSTSRNNPGTVVLRLGVTNTITAGNIWIGHGGKASLRELHLGSVTNVLNVDMINVGDGVSGRDSGMLIFESSSGSVCLRGSGGGANRANLNILVGTTGAGGSSNSTNTFDVTAHYADLLIDSLDMGDQPNRFSDWDNYFGFDQGVLDASKVSLSTACRSGTIGSSLMYLGGGTVNFGSLAMASSEAAATLDITGGQVAVNSDITKTGSGAGTIQVANATLLVKGRIASTNNPMNTLSLDGATLSIGRLVGYGNPTSALAAAGSLSLSGSCAIALTGTNYVVGQFPLISYAGTIGGSGGFAAITTFTPPPGVTATLVDNSANQTIDVNITAAPPLGQKASLGLAVAGGSLGLSWADLGMILQTNAVSVASPTDWHTYPSSTAVTNVTVTVDPAATNVFFRLVYP